MKEKKIHLLFLALALLIEIFVCNIRSLQSMFYKEIPITAEMLQIDGAKALSNGDLLIEDEKAYISLLTDNEKVRDIYVDAEVVDELTGNGKKDSICDVNFYIMDDLLYGGDSNTRYLTNRSILHDIPSSQYVFFASFGNTKVLMVEIIPQDGNIIRLHDLKLNAARPLCLSLSRFLIILLFMEMIFVFRPGSFLWKRKALEPGKEGYILLCGIYAALMIGIVGVIIRDPYIWEHEFNPYANLSKAFLSGELSVGTADPSLAGLEKELVSWGMNDERIMFDYALYNGRYYVYFGVLPCILLYLPYHLITGGDLPVAASQIIFLAFMIPGIYFLLKEIIRRSFKETSLAVHILLTAALFFGTNTMALMADPLVYHVAILSGMTLTIWGIYLALRALPFTEHRALLFGSALCLSLVAACRPTLLIFSAIMIPLALYSYGEWKREGKDKKSLTAAITVFAIPYAAVAAGLMVYNALRFGSPFQFGMIYNLTVIPSKDTAVSLTEMIPVLSWEYLFRFPSFDRYFPFLAEYNEDAAAMMSGSIYYFQTVGYGIFALNPMLWILILIPSYIKKNKPGHFAAAMGISLISSVFLMFFGFYMTQVVASRYTLEFSFAIFTVAAVIWLKNWPVFAEKISEKYLKALFAFMILAPVMIHSLQLFNAFSFPLSIEAPAFFYRLFYNWHFL